MHTITIADLLDCGEELTCADATAVAAQLLQEPVLADAGEPFGPPSLENIAVAADGSVRCLHSAATLSSAEVALLLQSMIRSASDRVPGGLRYAVGRALLEVEAPPFDSAADFATALARFEVGPSRQRLAALFVRADARRQPDATAVRGESTRDDRRRHEPSTQELRRDLREADLLLYQSERAVARQPAIVTRRLRRAPIAACMVAGVALVAAGELTHGRVLEGLGRGHWSAQSGRVSPGGAVESAPMPSTDTAGSSSRDIQLPPSMQPVRPVPPRARANADTPRATRTRIDADGRGLSHARRRDESEIGGSKAARDKGVIARIRFEWTNPFR